MQPEHIEVLQTLQRAGLLTRQATKSIRGQILRMPEAEAEDYLKKLIRRKGNEHSERKRPLRPNL